MTDDRRAAEDEGIPPFDEDAPNRPSDDDHQIPLPGDHPAAADDRVTAAEQREREPIADRLLREVPEPSVDEDRRRTAGRLVEETPEGVDVVRELEADEYAEDDAGLVAEEAAVTIREADEQMPDDPSTDQVTGEGADRGA